MIIKDFKEEIETDYLKIKRDFQEKDNLQIAYEIANQIKGYEKAFGQVFSFLISIFEGKLRNDKKTPLVFHSIYLTRLAYLCGEKNLDCLLTIALHDVLEDTEISEEFLLKQGFIEGHKNLINNLKILKENKDLSREPDGENLPPRYFEHIKRLVGSPKEVINTEVLDRFSDLMDLEYILELPEKDRNFRLKSKLIKVRSFVENIIRNRDDINTNCLELFKYKVKEFGKALNVDINVPLIIP